MRTRYVLALKVCVAFSPWALVVGCPVYHVPYVPTFVADAAVSDCQPGCANVAAICGRTEAWTATCTRQCERSASTDVMDGGLGVDQHPEQWVAAKTKPDVVDAGLACP